MYCTIAPSPAQGLLGSHAGHLAGLPTQLGLVRVQSSCSSGSGSESAFVQQAQTLHSTGAKYTVIGTDDLALHLATDRARSKKVELTERRTRADRQHCDSPCSAPPSILSAYHSSSSSSGNASPTSFYSLPNQDMMVSHLHSSAYPRPESPVVNGSASAQHRPSTRYHRPTGALPSPVVSPSSAQKSIFMNWKNNNVVASPRPNANDQSMKSNSLSRANASLGVARQCNETLSAQCDNLPGSKPSFYPEIAKQAKSGHSRKPQVPPKCEKVIEMLKNKTRKAAKTRAELNIKNNYQPQGVAVATAAKSASVRTEQTKPSAIELNAK